MGPQKKKKKSVNCAVNFFMYPLFSCRDCQRTCLCETCRQVTTAAKSKI